MPRRTENVIFVEISKTKRLVSPLHVDNDRPPMASRVACIPLRRAGLVLGLLALAEGLATESNLDDLAKVSIRGCR
jgi:hypothetical protein